MRGLILIFISLAISTASYSQASDFVTVKKRNNRTLKTYFPGSSIACKTVFQNYLTGIVQDVKNDSIFIRQYDVRAIPNMWGLAKIDTLATYVVGIHYKEIEEVIMPGRESFGFIKNGTILMIGGLGYAGLNLVNGKYLNESITSRENMKSLGIALGTAGAGLLINRLRKYNNRNGRRYRVEYVRMTGPARLRGA